MTVERYRAAVRALGLIPYKPSFGGATLHQDREGQFHQVVDPESLSPEERVFALDALRQRMGIHPER